MDVIFLDIDGVLNSKDYFIKRHPQVLELFRNNRLNNDIRLKLKRMLLDIDPNKLEILKEIIKATGAYVVVTSSWKRLEIFPYVKEQLISMGIPIIGTTTDNSSNRGEGIKKYLKENSVKRYIILDDDIFEDYDEELLQHLVKTSFVNDGLTDNHKKEAIMKLKKMEVIMDTKKVFEETGKIGVEQNKLRERIYQLNQCLDAIATQCSHEIVFKYTDNDPLRKYFKETYFCPACASTVHCFYKNELFETEFKSSRVIPLTDLSLKDSNKVNEAIRNEVYGNLDYYYDRNVPIEELSSNMEEKLVDLQTRYEEPTKGLRKFLKRK